jgi:hypothetical protein
MIYKINNPILGGADFIVPDQATADTAVASFLIQSVTIGTETNAQNKLIETQNALLTREASRFVITTTEVNGNDTVWRALSSDDPEIGVYEVFNYETGQYTKYQTLTDAKNAINELKQKLLTDCNLTNYTTVDALPKLQVFPKQPITTGTQTV